MFDGTSGEYEKELSRDVYSNWHLNCATYT